jgi:hypothetical protein
MDFEVISRVKSRDIEASRGLPTSQRTMATALQLTTPTYLESHVLPYSDWFRNSLEGCGKQINHIYGGVITSVTGTRRLSKRGKEMFAMRTGRLHTPVEIPTKKTFLQILALPNTAPSTLQLPVLPNGAVFTSLPPLIRASVPNTMLCKPATIFRTVIVFVAVPRVYHSIHTPWRTRQVGRLCNPRLLPRHPYSRDAANPAAHAAIGADTSCFAANLTLFPNTPTNAWEEVYF